MCCVLWSFSLSYSLWKNGYYLPILCRQSLPSQVKFHCSSVICSCMIWIFHKHGQKYAGCNMFVEIHEIKASHFTVAMPVFSTNPTLKKNRKQIQHKTKSSIETSHSLSASLYWNNWMVDSLRIRMFGKVDIFLLVCAKCLKVDISLRAPIPLFRIRISPQWLSRLRWPLRPQSCQFSMGVSFFYSYPLAWESSSEAWG